jgi:RNA polymerase-interacting CarD/CdnL/TRCF family regulator
MKKVSDNCIPTARFTGILGNFSNIITNEEAQKILLRAIKEKKVEEIFELVYNTQIAWGEEMKRRRASRKEYLKKQDIKEVSSFLDEAQKELEYYDKKAHDVAIKAMLWLNEATSKEQKPTSLNNI